jgi:hypothetical protein
MVHDVLGFGLMFVIGCVDPAMPAAQQQAKTVSR